MIQNPAGERPNSPTDNILEQIRDALSLARNAAPAEGGGSTTVNIILGPVFWIGTDFRVTAIAGGAYAEARDPGTDTWAEVDRWTNP